MEGGRGKEGEKKTERERMVQRKKRKKGGEGKGREEEERKEGGGRMVGMTSGDLGNEWSLELGRVGIEDLPVDRAWMH